MGNNPRRVYIYPSQQQYDGMPTSPFLPPDSTDDLYYPQPESFVGLGDGLLGMLLATMQRGQRQSGVDSGAAPNDAPAVDSDSDSGPQGGLLGRLAAPQAEQAPYQPLAGSSGQTPSEPRDPNFRRLSGTPVVVRPQRTVDSGRLVGSLIQNNDDASQAFNRSASPVRLVSGNNFSPEAQNSTSLTNRAVALADYLPNSTQVATSAGNGLFGGNNNKSGSLSVVDSPLMKTAQIAIPVPRPLSVPLPVNPVPPIPMPAIPDWLKVAWPILRRSFSHSGGGGNDDYRRCMRALAGGTDQWEEFCKNLGAGLSKTVGAETQKRACWSKTYESENNKKEWCKNQFGSD
jgi:hypothetical protein